MYRLICFLVLSLGLIGQEITTSSLSLIAPPPPALASLSNSIVGNAGNATYYYWVVVKYPIGDSNPSNSAIVRNAPNVLSGSNYVRLNWASMPNATGYDVLRTTTPNIPNGDCNCAVITDTTGNTVSDIGSALSAYTVDSTPAASTTCRLNNITGAAPTVTCDPISWGGDLTSSTTNPTQYSLVMYDTTLGTTVAEAVGCTWSTGTYIKYGLTTGYGSVSEGTVSGLAHQWFITGLNANTLYNYQVCNNSGSCDTANYTFTTSAAPAPLPALPTAPSSVSLPANPTVYATDVLVTSCSQVQTEINTAATLDGDLNYRIRVPNSYECAPGIPSGEGFGNTSPLQFPAKSGPNPLGTGWIVLEPETPPAENVRLTPAVIATLPIMRFPPAIGGAFPPPGATCALGRLAWSEVAVGWGLYECTVPASNTYSLVAKTDFTGSTTSCVNNNSWYYKSDAADPASLYWCADNKLYYMHIGSACTSQSESICIATNAHHYRVNGIRFLPIPIWSSGTTPQWVRDLYTASFAYSSPMIGGANSGVNNIIFDRCYASWQFPYRSPGFYRGLSEALRVTNNYLEFDYHVPTQGDSTGYNAGHSYAVQLLGGVGALVNNNYADISGITIFGADDNPTTNTDVTVSNNTLTNSDKHMAGTAANVTYCQGQACWFPSRHLVEFKRGNRIAVTGNILGPHFSSGNNQAHVFSFFPRPGSAGWDISDITLTNNRIYSVPALALFSGHNDGEEQSKTSARFLLDNNLIYDISGSRVATGAVARQGDGIWLRYGVQDVTITRNLIQNACTGYAPWWIGVENGPAAGLNVQNNISYACSVSLPWYWIGATSLGGGIAGLNLAYPASSGWTLNYNAFVDAGAGLGTGSGYPTGNFFNTVAGMQFVDYTANNYILSGTSPFIAGSPIVPNVSGPSTTNANLGPDYSLIPNTGVSSSSTGRLRNARWLGNIRIY